MALDKVVGDIMESARKDADQIIQAAEKERETSIRGGPQEGRERSEGEEQAARGGPEAPEATGGLERGAGGEEDCPQRQEGDARHNPQRHAPEALEAERRGQVENLQSHTLQSGQGHPGPEGLLPQGRREVAGRGGRIEVRGGNGHGARAHPRVRRRNGQAGLQIQDHPGRDLGEGIEERLEYAIRVKRCGQAGVRRVTTHMRARGSGRRRASCLPRTPIPSSS